MSFLKTPPTASHDSDTPPGLIEFMLKDWKQPSTKLPVKLKNLQNFKRRRREVSEKFPGQAIVVSTGHPKVRSNDCYYPFRAGTDFYYLTGNQEPDCVLGFEPVDGGHREILFVEPNPGKTDQTFYTDRIKGELWEGARLGVPGSIARYGISDCRPLSELDQWLGSLKSENTRVLVGSSSGLDSKLDRNPSALQVRDRELSTFLAEMRLIKDASEIRELQIAIDATQRGFEDVIWRLKMAKTERELEGVFYTRARMEGNDVGYSSIVASGAHACTLHWKKNDGVIRKGDLLLLDAGIEGNSLYTADITRTLPIDRKFTKEQLEIYQLVWDAQAAAFKEVKPGNDFMEPNRAAMRVLARGLEKLKILPTSADEALSKENQFYKRYSLHNVSHMLGIDVHDCAQARAETYRFGKLRPGMVLTIEPGLYFQLDDLTVPSKYRGIGIRIEDDVVVTRSGFRNLSRAIPSRPQDIEKWMSKIQLAINGPAPKRSVKAPKRARP